MTHDDGQNNYREGVYEEGYDEGTSSAGSANRRSAKAFLAAAGIVVGVAIVVVALFVRFQPEEKTIKLPSVEEAQLVFTSPADAEQQAEVRRLAGYDWAVLLNTQLDDKKAMLAVPYFATLELETAIAQHQLLNSSERYVSAAALQLLNNDSSLKGIMENLAVIEEAYYRLGLPSGAVHAGRLRHLARRLGAYGPPLGEIRDMETRLFVQERLGFAVDTFDAWYALIRLKHDKLLRNIEKTKDKKSVLTVEDYLGGGKPEKPGFVDERLLGKGG